jgi:hypothetical protein
MQGFEECPATRVYCIERACCQHVPAVRMHALLQGGLRLCQIAQGPGDMCTNMCLQVPILRPVVQTACCAVAGWRS